MNKLRNSFKLINRKQFFISALIGGPLVASCVAAYNLGRLKHNRKAFLSIFLGLVINLLHNAFIFLLIAPILRPKGMHRMGEDFLLMVIIYVGVQIILSFLITQLLKIKNFDKQIFPNDTAYYGKSQLVLIGLFSLVYLLINIDKPMLFAYFPNIIVLLYVLPHFYFYSKIKTVFRTPQAFRITIWIISVLACFTPLIFVLNDALPEGVMDIPMYLAEYYLYALLYLFLLIVGVAILGKTVRKLQLLPESFIQHPAIKIIYLIAVIIGTIMILIEGNIRFNKIVVNSYNIEVKAKGTGIKSLKICLVADMHLNNNTRSSFITDYVEHVSSINPDILLYGGDILEFNQISKSTMDEFDKQLSTLKPKYGKFIVGGNHDPFKYNGYDEKTDMTFLMDTVVKVANSFYLIGLKYRSSEKRPILKMKELVKENLPIFLIDHSPSQLALAAKNNIDIQLSGHTHYGQLWPFNYIVKLLYELPWGYKKINNTHFFVTSGIQGWGAPIRTVGQSEIMVINVKFVN